MPESFPGEDLETPLVDAASGDRAVMSMPRIGQRLDSAGQIVGAQPRRKSDFGGEQPDKVCCMRGVSSTHSRSKRCTKAAFAV